MTELHIIQTFRAGVPFVTSARDRTIVGHELARTCGSHRHPADVFRWVIDGRFAGGWKMVEHYPWP